MKKCKNGLHAGTVIRYSCAWCPLCAHSLLIVNQEREIRRLQKALRGVNQGKNPKIDASYRGYTGAYATCPY